MDDIVRKCFLQACINMGCITIDNAKDILKNICFSNKTESLDLKQVAEYINKEILEFGQSLKFVQHPLNRKEYLIFQLSIETKAIKMVPTYYDERCYFLKLLESIAFEEDYGIPVFDAFHISNAITPVSKQLPKAKAQELLDSWIRQGYYIIRDEKVHYGPRMLLEYDNHLKFHYPQYFKECPLCFHLVFWGIKCNLCNGHLHRECIRKFLIRNSHCPKCKGTWNTQLNL